MMKIHLNNSSFDIGTVVHDLPDTMAFNKKGKLINVRDFGTILIGNIPDEQLDVSLPQQGAPLFVAPEEWINISQVMKALGAFSSTSQARKNGWNFEIPYGCSSHIIKIAKVRGEIWIHRGE